jgi:hypothetical protein
LAVVPLSMDAEKCDAPFAVNIRGEFEKWKPRRRSC